MVGVVGGGVGLVGTGRFFQELLLPHHWDLFLVVFLIELDRANCTVFLWNYLAVSRWLGL